MSPHKISYGKDSLPISLQQSVIDHLGLEPGTTHVCKTCSKGWENWMRNEHTESLEHSSALQKTKHNAEILLSIIKAGGAAAPPDSPAFG